jgi:hypothetical protein
MRVPRGGEEASTAALARRMQGEEESITHGRVDQLMPRSNSTTLAERFPEIELPLPIVMPNLSIFRCSSTPYTLICEGLGREQVYGGIHAALIKYQELSAPYGYGIHPV